MLTSRAILNRPVLSCRGLPPHFELRVKNSFIEVFADSDGEGEGAADSAALRPESYADHRAPSLASTRSLLLRFLPHARCLRQACSSARASTKTSGAPRQ